jgi:hypothetical protein
MDKETWQSKTVAFVAIEREKLVSYVRHLIDGAADRDGEDSFHRTFHADLFDWVRFRRRLTSRNTRTSSWCRG